MPVHLLEKTLDYQLGIWKMDEDEELLLQISGESEPPSHVNKFRRMEYLAVRAMARFMGVPATEIAYLPSGKPYLLNLSLAISISHTKNYVAVLLSQHDLIGVDVEHRSERVLKIRHKFMHPEEESNLQASTMDELSALLVHWCAKESLFKSIPEEGVDFANELRISGLEIVEKTGRIQGTFLRTGQVFEIDYRIDPDFVLTCSFSTESK